MWCDWHDRSCPGIPCPHAQASRRLEYERRTNDTQKFLELTKTVSYEEWKEQWQPTLNTEVSR